MTAASLVTILILVAGTAALLALFDGVSPRRGRRLQQRPGQAPGITARPPSFARRFLARLPFVPAISAAVLLTVTLVRPE